MRYETDAKQFTPDELFCGMPKLKNAFRYLNRKISRYDHYRHSKGETKEGLIDERDRLLQTARELEPRDLKLIYYVKQLQDIRGAKICRLLKELCEGQRRLKDELGDK